MQTPTLVSFQQSNCLPTDQPMNSEGCAYGLTHNTRPGISHLITYLVTTCATSFSAFHLVDWLDFFPYWGKFRLQSIKKILFDFHIKRKDKSYGPHMLVGAVNS